jgi:hypothetical protein
MQAELDPRTPLSSSAAQHFIQAGMYIYYFTGSLSILQLPAHVLSLTPLLLAQTTTTTTLTKTLSPLSPILNHPLTPSTRASVAHRTHFYPHPQQQQQPQIAAALALAPALLQPLSRATSVLP